MSNTRRYRQGDVYIFPVKSIPKNAKRDEKAVLAYGEVTGHRHQVVNGDVFVDEQGTMFLRSNGGTEVKHLDESQRVAEHDTIGLPAGDYKIVIQEEYTPEGMRQVVD